MAPKKRHAAPTDLYEALGFHDSDEDGEASHGAVIQKRKGKRVTPVVRDPIEQRRRRFLQEEKRARQELLLLRHAQADDADEPNESTSAADGSSDEAAHVAPTPRSEGPKAPAVAEHKQIIRDAIKELPPDRTVYIGNLPFDADEDQLKDLLEESVGILEAMLFPRNNSGRPAGYAYVVFVDDECVAKASESVLEFMGRTLRMSRFNRKLPGRHNIKPKEMKKIAAAGRAKLKARRMKKALPKKSGSKKAKQSTNDAGSV